MVVLQGILLLLFVITSSFTNKVLIKVLTEPKTTKEGSSVTIPCSYLSEKQTTLKLLWFKNSNFDENLRKFTGTIVYSNTDEPKNSRVEYITGTTKDQEMRCDLRITDLQTTDSGNYQFRFIGSEIRYMSEPMTLTVTENPCKVIIGALELKNPLKESEEFTVNCFTFASCSKHPEWLNNTGQRHELISLTDMIIKTEEGDGRMVTTLKFNVTWKDDKRILSCRPGQDPDSYQIRNITLSVEYAPKETTANVSTEYVQEGDNVTLSCTSRGRPKVTFSWFKKEGIEKSQMSDFKLNPVKPEDSGNYFCEAKNSHGEMKSNIITIDVKYGPKDVTVKPLVNVTDLKEGDKLKLECSVKESNPEVKQFTWYNNNKLLQQTSNILFSEVTADNRGSYHCQANNYINSVNSNRILVSVKYSPRNLTIQGNHPVKVKTRLSLTCSADANPEPTQYTWKHTPGLSSFPLSSPNGQLNIDNVTIQHAGQYTCDATNTIGTRSHIINVDVLYPPSSVSLIMKSEVREFEVLSIICTVQSFPASNLTVTGPQYNLLNIQNNFRNITVSENKLTVYLNVTESDAGIYKCKGVNSEGKLEAQEDLTVLYAPKNVATSSKGEQTFGRELTLTCKAHSKPAASYEWKKSFNGQLKTVGHEQKLHFRSLSISDSGQFVCIVKNSIGENISQSVDIRVKYPPDINIVHNMTDERNWELPVYLTCSADAYPPASHYKWYREEDNTTVLSDQQNFTVQPQNPGMYYCTAANSIGKSRSKHIMLFVSNTVVLYRIILPIIFLLILIAVAIFMICRTINKARLDQQTGADYPLCFFPVFLSRSSTVANLLLLGSQNNTQENMSMEDILDPFHGRVNQSHPTPHSQDPTQTQDPYSRPNSNIHTVYSAIKLPPMTQGKQSPKSQKPGYMDNDLATSTLNYVTLDFKEQNEPKRAPEDSAVYAMVSKNKQSKNSESEHNDYENVSSACASRPPFNNIDWESDTSEEDEVNYTTVSCSAKPAVKEPKHNQRSHLGSSSSDDEDRTEYSAIKTVFK